MSAVPLGDDGNPSVVGFRTRGSDKLRWAIWSGEGPAQAGAWIRVVTTGEVGRLVVAPGKAIGVSPSEPLPKVVAHPSGGVPEGEEDRSEERPPKPLRRVRGRVGCPPARGAMRAAGTDGSRESARYRAIKARLPGLGSRIATPEGEGVVIASNVFTGTLTVRLDATSALTEVSRPLPDSPDLRLRTGPGPDRPEGA